jgi:TonB family protein
VAYKVYNAQPHQLWIGGNMNRLALAVVLCFCLCGCHKERRAANIPTPVPAPAMAAPALLSPANDAVFHAFPRTLTLEWTPVKGAARYGVEIDCYGCCAAHQYCSELGRTFRLVTTDGPSYTFDFVGDQPGKWRVWAISADSVAGPPSEWRQFTFGRVVGGSIIPPVPPTVNPAEVVACPADWRVSRFGSGAFPPKAVYDPDPEYTEEARRAKLSGSATLGITVGEDGLVKSVCILRTLRPDLDTNAVGAVKTWRFQPARQDGVPVRAQLSIEVHFRLL